MNTVKGRLLKFIKEINVTVAEFEREIGVSGGYVSNISKSIQPDKLEKISNLYPVLNLEWLLIGKGSMLKAIQPSTVQQSGNTASYTGSFRDVRTHIGSGTSIQGDGNAIGSGNNTGIIGGSDNRISYAQQKKAAILGRMSNNQTTELRQENEHLKGEVERLKMENEHLKMSLELKDTVIQAKDDLIKLLSEKK